MDQLASQDAQALALISAKMMWLDQSSRRKTDRKVAITSGLEMMMKSLNGKIRIHRRLEVDLARAVLALLLVTIKINPGSQFSPTVLVRKPHPPQLLNSLTELEPSLAVQANLLVSKVLVRAAEVVAVISKSLNSEWEAREQTIVVKLLKPNLTSTGQIHALSK